MFAFDENDYLQLLRLAKRKFQFIDLHEFSSQSGVCIWRHDVDISPHRSLSLASLENKEGIRAHYYFLFESRFYNLLEPDVVDLVREIASLGHHIGLHYDPSNLQRLDTASIEKSIKLKAEMLAELINMPITSLSIHDPGKVVHTSWSDSRIGGLLNATSSTLRQKFTYCSDSNGLWKSSDLRSVIERSDTTNLYALTHPGWWVPTPNLSPQERIERAVLGRAKRVVRCYAADLVAQNRQ